MLVSSFSFHLTLLSLVLFILFMAPTLFILNLALQVFNWSHLIVLVLSIILISNYFFHCFLSFFISKFRYQIHPHHLNLCIDHFFLSFFNSFASHQVFIFFPSSFPLLKNDPRFQRDCRNHSITIFIYQLSRLYLQIIHSHFFNFSYRST